MKGIFKYGAALLDAVHSPLLNTVPVCVNNFAQHCHFKIEPSCVNHPYCIFYKMRGFGLDGSQYGINNSFILALANQISENEDSALAEVQGLTAQLSDMQKETNAENEESAHAKVTLEEALSQVKRQVEEGKVENEGLAQSSNALNAQLHLLTTVVTKLKDDLANVESITENLAEEKELAEALANHMSENEDSALAVAQGIADQISCVENEKRELESTGKEQLELVERLQEANLALTSELEDKKAQLSVAITTNAEQSDRLASELTSIQEQLLSKDSENLALTSELEDKKAQLSVAVTKNAEQIDRLASELASIQEQLLSKDSEIEKLTQVVQNLDSSLNKCSADLSEMSMNCSIEVQKLSEANKELHFLRKELAQLNSHSDGHSCEETNGEAAYDQVSELQQLLAAANAREEEARNIALAADEELEHNFRECKETVLYATECEAAAQEWEEKFRSLELRQSSSSNEDEEEVLKEMELLVEEKIDLENQVECVKAERDAVGKI